MTSVCLRLTLFSAVVVVSLLEKCAFQGYRRMSKKFHPDKLASMGGATVELPNGLEPEAFFIELKKAHDVLTHDLRRSFYDRFGDMQEGEEQRHLCVQRAGPSLCLFLI